MKFRETKIKDLFVIEYESFQDERGLFYRIYCKKELKFIGYAKDIVQINVSSNIKKGTLRGMHFQYPPKAEIKLIKCIKGSIYDVAIDLRKNSNTFLKWHSEILTAENMKTMYIPEGFAHGFQTLEPNCDVLYLHSEFYSPKYESGVRYNDPKLNITWPLEITAISKRDREHKLIDNNFRSIQL